MEFYRYRGETDHSYPMIRNRLSFSYSFFASSSFEISSRSYMIVCVASVIVQKVLEAFIMIAA